MKRRYESEHRNMDELKRHEREMEREMQRSDAPKLDPDTIRIAQALANNDFSGIEDILAKEGLLESYRESMQEEEVEIDRNSDYKEHQLSPKEKEDLKRLTKALETGDYSGVMDLLADEEIIEEGKDCCVTPNTSKKRKIAKFSDYKKK